MKLSSFKMLFGLVAGAVMIGCGTVNEKSDAKPGYLDASAPVEERVADLLVRMTLEEKIAQMDQHLMHTWRSKKDWLKGCGIGSFLGEISPEDYNEMQKLAEQSRLKIPVLVGIDACHGFALMPNATVFPTNISAAATFNKELGYNIAKEAGRETRGWAHHWVFTPTLDVTQDARFGRSGETFGECPYVHSVMADAYVRGYQGNLDPKDTVAACPKHYVGGGASQGGCNHASAEISERTLRTIFLKPFKAAVDAGCLSIMGGHNDVAGVPAHASKWLLTDILKEEFGFKGVILSDMGDVWNLKKGGLHWTAEDHKSALAQSFNAGMDIYMYSRNGRADFVEPMMELVEEGRIPMSRIDDACSRVLRVKFMLGLFEKRYVDVENSKKIFGSGRSHKVALQAARETICLVKNDKNLLPIKGGQYKKILVTGPNANNQNLLGDWTFKQPEDNYITVLEGVQQVAGKDSQVEYFNCGKIKGKASKITKESIESADPRIVNQKIAAEGGAISDFSIQQAVARAKDNDLVVVAVGGNGQRWQWGGRTYGESCDRPSIALYGRQLDLVKALQATGKPVVVVFINGKPLSEQWIFDNCPAIIKAWEPGMFGGQAIAEVIFGEYNPSGRLPFTIPRSAAHIPQYYYQRHSRMWTGYAIGTSRYDDHPAYPFGHGLSYTTFEYSELTVPKELPLGKKVPVSVKVTNTGDIAGDHSVLMYVSDVVATVAPAVKELKGFDKIHLKPGESRVVKFTLGFDDLAIWDVNMNHVVESGEFVVRIGDKNATFWIKEGASLPVDEVAFTDSVSVKIDNFTAAAEIRYTLDGTLPKADSSFYTEPLKFYNDAVLRAAAFKDGKRVGKFVKGIYKRMIFEEPVKVSGVSNGLAYKCYVGSFRKLPGFSKLKPYKSGRTSTLNIGESGRRDHFAMVFDGYFKAEKDGLYKFTIKSDDGSRLLVNGKVVADYDGLHGFGDGITGQVALKAGLHKLEVQYFEASGGHGLSVEVENGGRKCNLNGLIF